MHIKFRGLSPRYFQTSSQSEVWNKDLILIDGIHCFSGRSGRGKTSLLSTLCGISSSLDGSIVLEPKNPCLAYLDQNLSYLEDLSARQNLELAIQNYPAYPALDLENLVDQFGISSVLDKKASCLSRGELQRLLIVRTLAIKADLIVADEPCAHLDSGWAQLVFSQLAQRSKQGTMVVISSLDSSADLWPHGTKVQVWRLD